MKDTIQKEYYTVHEVSEMINETTVVVNFWRKVFKVPSIKSRSFNHAWKFPRPSVAIFHLIKNLLRNEKYTLEGAKQKLKQLPK